MADDMRYMGFWIGHLHQGERNRIHLEGPNHQEREMLAKGEDPWAKFRGPLPPNIPPYVPPEPSAPLAEDGTTIIHPGPASDEIRADEYSDADVRDYFDRKTSPHDHHILSINSQAKSFGEPWHKRGDLVLAVILACVGLVVAIALVILPPTSPRAITFWLLVMFILLAVSALMTARFFDWSRRSTFAALGVPALLVIAFGFYAWPTMPTKSVSDTSSIVSASPSPIQPSLVTKTPIPTATASPISSPQSSPSIDPIFTRPLPGSTPPVSDPTAPISFDRVVEIKGLRAVRLDLLMTSAGYKGSVVLQTLYIQNKDKSDRLICWSDQPSLNETTGTCLDPDSGYNFPGGRSARQVYLFAPRTVNIYISALSK